MNKSFSVFGILLILSISNIISYSQSGWVPQTSWVTQDLLDVKLLNSSTGYVGGKYGTFLKTTNGGINWYQMNSMANDITIIHFISAGTGYIVTGGFRSDDLTYVKKTTNGGESFYPRIYLGPFHDSEGINMDFDFIGSSTIYVVFAVYGFKTTNGGDDWESMYYQDFWKMSFLNTSIGFRYTAGSYNLERTTDGAQLWTEIHHFLPPYPQPCYFNFFDMSTGYLIDRTRGIYTTSDGGVNWQNYGITNNTNYILKNAYFYNVNTGWAVSYAGDSGRGLVYKTTNAGVNWFRQYVGTNQQIRTVYFTDANTGWIVGNNGIIYKTTNGGGNPIGIQPISNEVPKAFVLHQNYPNPFNPGTEILFEIPNSVLVKLNVYDVTGKMVAVLVNEVLAPGKYHINWSAEAVAAGIYFYSLETEGFKQARKMIVIK
jgi:photosystem II stability/assembly factor-like uncharacterized protein